MVRERESDGSCCAKRHSRAPTQRPCSGSEEFDAPHVAKTTRTGLRTQQHSQIQAFQATSSEQLRISFQENIPGTTRQLHHPRRRGGVQSQIFLFFYLMQTVCLESLEFAILEKQWLFQDLFLSALSFVVKFPCEQLPKKRAQVPIQIPGTIPWE